MTLTSLIRVLIADDHPVVRSGLVMMINLDPEMDVVGEVATGREAVEVYHAQHPDVTLMDLRMPNMNGVEAIRTICQADPTARLIVLTTYDSDEDIFRGLQAGAKGYLLKDSSRQDILNAIRRVHSGQKYIPAVVGEKLAERMSNPPLSDREREVLTLLAQGLNNAAIATELKVSEGTVKFHITHLLSKLGASDRTQAVVLALRRGIVEL